MPTSPPRFVYNQKANYIGLLSTILQTKLLETFVMDRFGSENKNIYEKKFQYQVRCRARRSRIPSGRRGA